MFCLPRQLESRQELTVFGVSFGAWPSVTGVSGNTPNLRYMNNLQQHFTMGMCSRLFNKGECEMRTVLYREGIQL